MATKDLIYLDTYVLQKDMRIRLPKSILSNLQDKTGETQFEIFYMPSDSQIILKKAEGEDQ